MLFAIHLAALNMTKSKKTSSLKARTQAKIEIDMKKFKEGTLHSGPGKKHIVTSKEQALAIAYSQARKKK